MKLFLQSWSNLPSRPLSFNGLPAGPTVTAAVVFLMGRTLPTTTQIIQDEQRAFNNFRRALRKEDQLIFDELFARARKHIMAINQADHALPFEAILLAMLLEVMQEMVAIKRQVEL